MTQTVQPPQTSPPFDDKFIDDLLLWPESSYFECKRLAGKLTTVLESVVALANTEGGIIAIGFEDPDKAKGRARVYGIQENPTNWDELRRQLQSRITEPNLLPCSPVEIGCTLRDGTMGSVVFLKIEKSNRIHSIVDDGTWVRLEKGNKELTANEINDLSFARGTISAEAQLEPIDVELLDTDYWKQYAQHRRLTRPIAEALRHTGLARPDTQGALRPTRAAVLLFAEEPSGLLNGKAAVRVFHYRGNRVQTDPHTNLLKPPRTISGPIIRQIQDTTDYVLSELTSGVQMGPLGFEVIQSYPVRVIKEAITNALIHRDYRLPADVHIRIFSDRIEVESPGLLVGPVTAVNIGTIGTHTRNPVLVNHLRDFPSPPNLDAGEGVRMMFGTMQAVGLYPPLYLTRPQVQREVVIVFLLNDHRPTAWKQVSLHIDQHGSIGNTEVRKAMETADVLTASKQIKKWLEQGLLIILNPTAGTRARRYSKPNMPPPTQLFSTLEGKQRRGKT